MSDKDKKLAELKNENEELKAIIQQEQEKEMDKATWQQIVDLSEVIAKKLRNEDNPHQMVIIDQHRVRLIEDEKSVPLPESGGSVPHFGHGNRQVTVQAPKPKASIGDFANDIAEQLGRSQSMDNSI